ncbi:MAG TPA: hypothetical protein EYN04_07380 [Porticoccaceae bacterium]|nr:hypothetical protein [Porticoccaceae bacterium]
MLKANSKLARLTSKLTLANPIPGTSTTGRTTTEAAASKLALVSTDSVAERPAKFVGPGLIAAPLPSID